MFGPEVLYKASDDRTLLKLLEYMSRANESGPSTKIYIHRKWVFGDQVACSMF